MQTIVSHNAWSEDGSGPAGNDYLKEVAELQCRSAAVSVEVVVVWRNGSRELLSTCNLRCALHVHPAQGNSYYSRHGTYFREVYPAATFQGKNLRWSYMPRACAAEIHFPPEM
jgi:hypothetical protein